MVENVDVSIEDAKFISIKFQCPGCGSGIGVSFHYPYVPKNLGEAVGTVRCGKCSEVISLDGLTAPEDGA